MLSIIIPVYNGEKYIKRCLDKVLSIDLSKEIIVVNDNSTDNSLSLLQTYKPQITIINLEKHSGLSNARNEGVKTSLGDYVVFIDVDDEIDPAGYVETFNKAKSKEADVLIFNLDFVYKKKVINTRNTNLNDNSAKNDLIKSLLLDRLYPSACTLMISKEIAKSIQFDVRLSPGEDINYLLKLLIKSRNPLYFNKTIYHYIQQSGSILHTLSEKLVTCHLNVIDYLDLDCIDFLDCCFKLEFQYFRLQMIYRAVHAVSLAANSKNRREAAALIKKCKTNGSFKKIYKSHFSPSYLKIEFFILNVFGARVHLFLFPVYNFLRKTMRKSRAKKNISTRHSI